MPSGTAKHDVTYWTITDTDDLFAVWQFLPTISYRGDLSCWPAADGPGAALIINREPPTPAQANLRAVIGDVVVWDNTNLAVLPAADFDTHYRTT